MEQILEQLEQVFSNTNSFAYSLLRKGNDKESIRKMLNQENIANFPQELVNFYQWHDGMEDSNEMLGKLELFNFGYFLSLKKALTFSSTNQSLSSKNFFPLFTNNGGDFLLYNFKDRFIYFDSPVLLSDKKPISKYDSFGRLLETIKECYAEKAYYFQDDFLEIDYNKEEAISKRLNPLSKYWKQR